MSHDPLKADYQELLQAFVQLSRLAEQAQDVRRSLQQNREALDGEWIGFSSDKFFSEMDDYVLPSLKKLEEALQSSAKTMGEISRRLSEAEQIEASNIQAVPSHQSVIESPTPQAPLAPAPKADGLIHLDETVSLPRPTAQLFGEEGFTQIALEYGENGILGISPDGVDLIPNGASSNEAALNQPINALYGGILFVDPTDPHRAYLIPDDNPDITITYAHINTEALPLDPESGTLFVDAGDQVGTLMDISQEIVGNYPEGIPNHLHLSVNARAADPETGKQAVYDVKKILGLN